MLPHDRLLCGSPLCGLRAILLLALLVAAPWATADDRAPVDFDQQIAPLLGTYCVGCHTEGEDAGELTMDSYAALMEGGEHGTAITPGQPESSRLWMMTTGQVEPKMPPDDMEGPDEEELQILRRWIEEGARGPAGTEPQVAMLRTPHIEPRAGQTLPITAMAISPDQRLLAVARFATVELREIGTDQLVRRVTDQVGKINDLRFSADGSRIIIASGVTGLYGTATVVRVADGAEELSLKGHRDTIYAAAFSPDGRTIATGGYDRNVILWDAAAGTPRQTLTGHNGAIFDLAFSGDGAVLATASADETAKLWSVADGQRLDTLSQPQGEVWAVAFTPDGQSIVALSSDNRFRVWKFESRSEPRINPLLETRFADEAPLVRLAFTPDGGRMIVASQAGRLGLFDTTGWGKISTLPSAGDLVTHISVLPGGDQAYVATMGGELLRIDLPAPSDSNGSTADADLREIYLQTDTIAEVAEAAEAPPTTPQTAVALPRGAKASGVIKATAEGTSEPDWYRFDAKRGEVWIAEIRAAQDGSPLDSIIEIGDAQGQPINRVRLQAVRDSYFTFRGKDSTQSTDFRLFAWEEMELNDLLYAAGEVTRLWMYPRGPDSGFNVYPGTGTRTTFYDTSPVTHALQDPAYVVRPLGPGEPVAANGLPVFEIPYANDDDAARQIGTDSRLRFTAPEDGSYTIRVADTRNVGGDDYRYQLILRPASPDYRASVSKVGSAIPAGGGREFRVSIERLDGFQGPVSFEIEGLPAGLQATQTVMVEEGQQEAYGVVWAAADMATDQTFAPPKVTARAEILGRVIEHAAGDLGELKTAPQPQALLAVEPDVGSVAAAGGDASSTLVIHPGETISAIVRVERHGLDGEIRLGNEFAGRNLPFGVFVDNIGLNGLMILKDADHQQFFITASPVAAPGQRLFHLKADFDGGVTSIPVMLDVQP